MFLPHITHFMLTHCISNLLANLVTLLDMSLEIPFQNLLSLITVISAILINKCNAKSINGSGDQIILLNLTDLWIVITSLIYVTLDSRLEELSFYFRAF